MTEFDKKQINIVKSVVLLAAINTIKGLDLKDVKIGSIANKYFNWIYALPNAKFIQPNINAQSALNRAVESIGCSAVDIKSIDDILLLAENYFEYINKE